MAREYKGAGKRAHERCCAFSQRYLYPGTVTGTHTLPEHGQHSADSGKTSHGPQPEGHRKRTYQQNTGSQQLAQGQSLRSAWRIQAAAAPYDQRIWPGAATGHCGGGRGLTGLSGRSVHDRKGRFVLTGLPHISTQRPNTTRTDAGSASLALEQITYFFEQHFLLGRFRSSLFLLLLFHGLLGLVHCLDDQEQHKSHDQESNNSVDE